MEDEAIKVYEDPIQNDFFSIGHITVPPNLPHIIKVFTKAVIRSQPVDLWTWTTALVVNVNNSHSVLRLQALLSIVHIC